MGRIGEILVGAAVRTPDYAQRLLAGIAAKDFARFARPGGVLIKSNHPAFIFGHLSLYPAKVLAQLALPPGDAAVPASYDALFNASAECLDDPDGRIYPPMDQLTGGYFAGTQAALAALRGASDELLLAPNPLEGRMRELFPQLGGLLGFYVTAHAHGHLGQLSAWRRAMGMPAA